MLLLRVIKMITPKEFKESFLKDENQRFALWFQHTVENVPKTSISFSKSEQCFSIPITDVPKSFVKQGSQLENKAEEIVYKFGWEITYSPIDKHLENSVIKITFHWTDEEVDTPENKAKYEKEYKYVTFNSTMWKYGHNDMKKFDDWFNKVADEHRRNLSYNELIGRSLIISYDELKKADVTFVEDYTYIYKEREYYASYVTCEEKELKTITLKEFYVEHLESLGWKVKDGYFDKKYCLVCY